MEASTSEESNCVFSTKSFIAPFLKLINNMAKKPSIEADLSQVLDNFLQKLDETDPYLRNGICNMNFAEAALLLQSSVDLYGKKVDMLWDMIFDYQHRIVVSDEKNDGNKKELESIEERKRKYKRKRKTKLDESQTKSLINSYSFGTTDDINYLNRTYEPHDLLEEWERIGNERQVNSDSQSQLCPIKKTSFLPDTSVYNEDREYIGRFDQFHSNSIIEDIFHLEQHSLLPDENGCITKMRIDCYVINDFLSERLIPSNKPPDFYINELNEYINNFIERRKNNVKDTEISCNALQQRLCAKESFVNIERLPFSVIRDKLRRTSLADSLLDDDNFSSVSDVSNHANDVHIQDIDIDNCECDSEVAALVNEMVSKVSGDVLTDVDKEIISAEENADALIDQLVRTMDKRNKSCSQDSAFYELDEELDETLSRRSRSVVNTPALNVVTPNPPENSPITNKMLCCGGCVVIPKVVRMKMPKEKKIKEKDDKLMKPPPPKKRRISEKMLKKLSTGLTVGRREFERFCRLNYKPDEHEGQVPAELSSESESESSDDDDEVVPDLPDIPEVPEEDDEEENQNETVESDLPNNISEDPASTSQISEIHEIADSNVLNVPSRTADESDSDTEQEGEASFRKNVREWRSFILPKLKTMENRSDFDIHEYGDEILRPHELGTDVMFSDVVNGKNTAEIARYFLATLQLANTNNIEISGVTPGETANDTFKLTVKDKTKHHELLEEYQAPSEETFRERLEKAKAMNPRVVLHSTPSVEPLRKKAKLDKASQRKLSNHF